MLERVDVIQPALFAMNVALGGGVAKSRFGAVGRCGAQPGRDRGGGGGWHFDRWKREREWWRCAASC